MKTRVLAAPSVDESGGGIAQVSALAWRAFQQEWPGEVAMCTLLPRGDRIPSLADKLRFGKTIGSGQLMGRARNILFTHVGLAQTQRFVPQRARAPYAVFLHGIESWRAMPPAQVRAIRGAAVRLANSHFTARKAASVNPDLGEIDVCALAIPDLPPAVHPAADRRTLDVLIVGRMAAAERYKGHDRLLAIWRDVVAAVPSARLVIAGDGDDRARLETVARDAGLGDRVQFTGFVSRQALESLYANAALFAMPSRGEGFGLVYLEAMAHQLACVGSTLDAAGEIVVDGETGVLVDPDDTSAVARAVVDLLRDESRRRAMGCAGRRRVEARFTFDRFRARLTGVLDRAFGEGAPARAAARVSE